MTFDDDDLYGDNSGQESDSSAEVYSADGFQEGAYAEGASGLDDDIYGDAPAQAADNSYADVSSDGYADASAMSDSASGTTSDSNQDYGGEWDNASQESPDDVFSGYDETEAAPVAAVGSDEETSSDEEEESSFLRTMTVGNTTYAASIYWQPLQDVDNPMPELRETAEVVLENNADLYVIRPSGEPQYGLGFSKEGHKSGMPVAALALADAFSDVSSSVAVFKVPEGWWFVAIRNGMILSADDMLYKNESEAKANFASMMAVPDWGRRVAPAEWGFDDTEDLDIVSVFEDTPKIKLSKLKGGINIKVFAILAIAVILVAWVGFALLSRFSATEEIIQEVAIPLPIIKQPVVEKPKMVSVPMPWESLVPPADFISICARSTSQLMAAKVPGWTIGDINCQHVGLSTSWNMVQGRLSYFKQALDMYNVEGLNFTISDNGRSVVGSINFGALKRISSPPKYRAQEIVTQLTDMFQALNVPLSTNVQNVSPMVTSERVLQQDPYSYVEFSFSSNLPISAWGGLFSYSALELTNMVYNVNSNTWKYEGRIYGKK